MEERIFQCPAIFHVGSPTKDRGMRFRGETQELTDDEKLAMLSFDGEFGYFLFKSNEFQESDVPKIDAHFESKKPSERLRSVLYVYHQKAKIKTKFNDFYSSWMDKKIDQIKSEIEKIEDADRI